MNYWHIQIFKIGDESGTEKRILEEKGFIGLGYTITSPFVKTT